MMTREEAIEIIEYARAFNEKNTLLMRALDMAVYCLRFQDTFECQKDHFPDLTKMRPLALEQLREIKKPTPAWIVPLGEKGWDAQWSLRHIGPLVYFRVDSRKKKAKSYLLYDDRYGTDWLAYPYPLPHIDREAWTAEWRELHGDKMVGVNDAGEDMYKHYHYCVCKSCGKGSAVKTNFCPHCGKAMTEDAWAELERRLTK